MNLRRYHRFNFDAPVERKRDPKWLEAYRSVWQEAVACRMPAEGPIGTENSGGLDSGSITAELAKQLAEKRQRHRLYGFGFAYAGLEPEYIMEVARHCEIANNYLQAGEIAEPAEGWEAKELRIAGYPNEHPNGTRTPRSTKNAACMASARCFQVSAAMKSLPWTDRPCGLSCSTAGIGVIYGIYCRAPGRCVPGVSR